MSENSLISLSGRVSDFVERIAVDVKTINTALETTVKSVNEAVPDSTGNVTLEIPSSVYIGSTKPTDDNTNVWINPDSDYSSAVRLVNNERPDGDGNVTITSVQNATKATQDAKGNIIDSTYATKAELSNISRVTSVNSKTGDVTLTSNDIGALSSQGGIFTGYLQSSNGNVARIQSSVNDSHTPLLGGSAWDNGARVVPYGKDHETKPGWLELVSTDGTNVSNFVGKPDGTLTWSGKNVVRSVNGTAADAAGNVSVVGTVPVSTVIAFAANSAPSGYLLCNGSAVSRTTYADLFAKIGTTYGSGDGSTTFNLPNLTDRFIQGSGTAGTYKDASIALPDHIHAFGYNNGNNNGTFVATNANESFRMRSSTGTRGWNGSGGGGGYNGNASTFSANMVTSLQNVTTGSSSVQPPALTMRMYIKY